MRISDWSSDVCSSDLSDEAIREFRQWDDAGIMVVQPQAASLGIDLSTSSKMIWYGLIPSYVDYTQCCDRIALSRNSTKFVYLLADRAEERRVGKECVITCRFRL